MASLSCGVGCEGPQSALNPAGPAAQTIAQLWWGMFTFFSAVLLAVVVLWLYAMKRPYQTHDEAQARRIQMRWIIGGGIILPMTSVLVLLSVSIPAGQRILTLPTSTPPLRIEVIGNRWWWAIRYPDSGVITTNQLYLPVDQVVDVYVSTADVIHSLWVPRLAGKIDLIPGRTNHLRLLASTLGSMRGQCAEFCGNGHAFMVLEVEVLAADDFAQWLSRRQTPVTVVPEHQQGAAAFSEHCGACHRVAGITAGGNGPDLTQVGGRRLLGPEPRDGQPFTVSTWLATHPTGFEGAATPDHRQLAVGQRDPIAAWLETLGHD
jgi:cytochrome c oxidase subunit II